MEYQELKELQSLPLRYKVMISQQRIKEWYEHWGGKVYVSFSGGKDSTVLLRVVRELYPEVPAVFVDTGLEYPEIRKFVKSIGNVVWLKPQMTFKAVLEKYGYPVLSKKKAQYIGEIQTPTSRNAATIKLRTTGIKSDGSFSPKAMISKKWQYLRNAPFKISDKCCAVMKEEPFKSFVKETGSHPLSGVMAADSQTREDEYLERNGCNYFDGTDPKSWPIGFWLESDIWEYIHTYNVPYSPIYDMGYSRTGCMFCMFGVHLEPEPNRFQMMQVTHPRLWSYCMFQLGLAPILDYIGVRWNDNDQLWTTKEVLNL